jgi:hypothetical protein
LRSRALLLEPLEYEAELSSSRVEKGREGERRGEEGSDT